MSDPLPPAAGRRRRRARPALAASALILSVVAPGPVANALAPAKHDPSGIAPIDQSAWFWDEQISGVDVSGSPPEAVPDPSVPSGDVAVAGPEESGNPQKETYLQFDVSEIPPGSTIDSFVLTLPVDPSGTNLIPTGSAAPIIACAPEQSWPPGQAEAFSSKPSDDCTTNSPKVIGNRTNTSFSVNIASIAEQWVEPSGLDFGVAITNDPNNTTTVYQIDFGPASSLSSLQGAVTYTPPASIQVITTTVPATFATVPSTVPPVPATSPVVAAPAPSAPAPVETTPPTTPAPAIAALAPSTTTPPKAALAAASSTPPAGFWIVLILLLLLLVLASYTLGGVPVATEVTGRGVSRVLGRSMRSSAEHTQAPIEPPPSNRR